MRPFILLAVAMSFVFGGAVFAQQPPPPQPQPAPAYNPYRAVHDVEVGKFYLKRGDLTGAISRFKEALLYKSDYAEPCLLLGKAYEKKDDPASAIHYYQEYLKILPDTPESRKVRERIAKLQEKMKKEAPSGSPNQAKPSRNWMALR